MKNRKITHRILSILLTFAIVASLCSCAKVDSDFNDVNGSITGNTYECQFYSNDGQKFMTVSGSKIDMNSNIIRERTFNGDSWGYTNTLSSVVTITVDGCQISNCGSTVLFTEKGLEPDVNFQMQDINSNTDGSIGDNAIVANVVNKYKNAFGKPVVVVIQSQLGNPICAYSGKDVYWKVCEDLPKTTKLMIDDKALYIHRANFQIIDLALLNQ